tara:strand:- start:152 stop:340 length:189 start_codon:yes stop_codon:yes gene_type:complete
MPYRVDKKDNVYKLFNLTKKEYVKVNFKTRESAIKSGINYMSYRGEKPILKGNKLINKKKNK